MKYERKGFVAFNYTDKMPSDEAKTYIRKIINLCETNNIKLVFLTLPMYHKHVHNYNAYKSELAKYLKGQHWIDFQSPYDSLAFTPACFENTVSGNQHMTYYGALVTAYKVASYLRTNFTNVLPNRSSTMEWKQLFYASDGYFENYPPENDGISKVLLQNTTLPNGSTLKELSFVPSNGAKKLLVKLNKDNTVNMYGKVMKVLVMASINGREEQIELEAQCSMAYAPDSHIVFISAPINPAVELNKILNIRIL
jgi:hypothetical protein